MSFSFSSIKLLSMASDFRLLTPRRKEATLLEPTNSNKYAVLYNIPTSLYPTLLFFHSIIDQQTNPKRKESLLPIWMEHRWILKDGYL